MKQLQRSKMVFLFLMPLLTLTPAASGQAVDASAQWFRVSWGPRTYAATPSIEGYVHNDSRYRVSNVRLRIEGFDVENRPVGERHVWTFGNIAPSDRGYFVAQPVRGAATYRITVVSFDVVSREP